MKFLLRVLLLMLLSTPVVPAEVVQVAVASNFSKPMQQIAQAFNQATGHEAKLSFGSSGKFVAQISHGAPFDVFLSADTDKPLRLVGMGLADANTRFTYARGRLVLWSADADYITVDGAKTGVQVLANADFKHLALADAKLAPYGRATQEVLANLQLSKTLRERLVTGENISQAYQFVSTGNAELGFVAASQVYRDGALQQGSAWLIPQEYYMPINQDAILLKAGRGNLAALALLEFLRSEVAIDIIKGFEYGVLD